MCIHLYRERGTTENKQTHVKIDFLQIYHCTNIEYASTVKYSTVHSWDVKHRYTSSLSSIIIALHYEEEEENMDCMHWIILVQHFFTHTQFCVLFVTCTTIRWYGWKNFRHCSRKSKFRIVGITISSWSASSAILFSSLFYSLLLSFTLFSCLRISVIANCSEILVLCYYITNSQPASSFSSFGSLSLSLSLSLSVCLLHLHHHVLHSEYAWSDKFENRSDSYDVRGQYQYNKPNVWGNVHAVF